MTEELEFCGGADDDKGCADCEFEIGDDTLDLSLEDLFLSVESNFVESAAMISCFVGPCGCLIMPYNTSAISISISS